MEKLTEIRALGWLDIILPWLRWRDFGTLYRERGRALAELRYAQMELARMESEFDSFTRRANEILNRKGKST